jgi:hypothetical protein
VKAHVVACSATMHDACTEEKVGRFAAAQDGCFKPWHVARRRR